MLITEIEKSPCLGIQIKQRQEQREREKQSAQEKAVAIEKQCVLTQNKLALNDLVENLKKQIKNSLETGNPISVNIDSSILLKWDGHYSSFSPEKWGNPLYEEWLSFKEWLDQNGLVSKFSISEGGYNEGEADHHYDIIVYPK